MSDPRTKHDFLGGIALPAEGEPLISIFTPTADTWRVECGKFRIEGDAQHIATELGRACQTIYKYAAELTRLRADRKTLDALDAAAGGEDVLALIEAAKKLPLTKDGVRIALGMNLFARVVVNEGPLAEAIVPCGFIQIHRQEEEGYGTVRDVNGDEYEVEYTDCYSTRAAAESARESEGPK